MASLSGNKSKEQDRLSGSVRMENYSFRSFLGVPAQTVDSIPFEQPFHLPAAAKAD